MMTDTLILDGSDWQIKEFIGLDWKLRGAHLPDSNDHRHWIPACVPGSVVQDLMQAGKAEDLYFGLNSKKLEWTAERSWVYRKTFKYEGGPKKHAYLHCKGLDYRAAVYLNGCFLGSHCSQFTPFEKEISDILKEGVNYLAIVLWPAPQEQAQIGRTSLVRTHKTRMNYWWDFSPRLPHLGVWDSVLIRFDEGLDLNDLYLYSSLNKDRTMAKLCAEVDTHKLYQGGYLELEAAGQKSKCFFTHDRGRAELSIPEPKLWWPNNTAPSGIAEPQYQYDVSVRLYTREGLLSDERKFRRGIYDLSWKDNPGAPGGMPPYTMTVNGHQVYVKGVNWVPQDILYGVERDEKLRRLIRLAAESGVMLFRVWGGGLIEKDRFYELCAEAGILVWQEFIQSSSGVDNRTSEDAETLKLMLREAQSVIKRKRNHTALALWCGGNELQDDNDDPEHRDCLIPAVLGGEAARLDPGRRFLPTSSYGGKFFNSIHNNTKYPDRMGDVHGPWEHQGFDSHCRLYNGGKSLFSSEFGVEGMAFDDVLKKTIPAEKLRPVTLDNDYYFHRAQWWLKEETLKEAYGDDFLETKALSLRAVAHASQYLQFEGLRYALESQIKRRPVHSGSLPWQFNEPYPNAVCTNLVDYYTEPKGGYYAMKSAYRKIYPACSFASQRITDQLLFELYLHAEDEEKHVIRYQLFDAGGKNVAEEVFKAEDASFRQKCRAEGLEAGLYLLRLTLDDKYINEYMFTAGENYKSLFDYEPQLVLHKNDDEIKLKNDGERIAWWLQLRGHTKNGQKPLVFSENLFCLLPGEEKIVMADSKEDCDMIVNAFGKGVQPDEINLASLPGSRR